jgi:hypothetical protein
LDFEKQRSNNQGDQIGRIFVPLLPFGQFFNYRRSLKFLCYFSRGSIYFDPKKWIGLHFGPFFAYAYGHPGSNRNRRQGDQIVRIFAQWSIVYFGHFLENYRSIPQIWATIFSG